MKNILKLTLLFFLIVSCKSLENKNKPKKSEVYFKINPEKTFVDNIGAIMLSFNIFNDSNDEIVILRPRNTFAPRISFFSNTMECDNIPLWVSESGFTHRKVTKYDFVMVEPHTNIELLMNGRYSNMLACESDSVRIQLKYEPLKIIDYKGEYQDEMEEIGNKITNINISSDNVKFKLVKRH